MILTLLGIGFGVTASFWCLVLALRAPKARPGKVAELLVTTPESTRSTSALIDLPLNSALWRRYRHHLLADLRITGQTEEGLIRQLSTVLAILIGVAFLLLTGLLPSPFGGVGSFLLLVVAAPLLVGALLYDLRQKADQRRLLLAAAVESLQVSSYVLVGSNRPLVSAVVSAIDSGNEDDSETAWVFQMLRSAIYEGAARNMNAYESLTKLADEIGSDELATFSNLIRRADRQTITSEGLKRAADKLLDSFRLRTVQKVAGNIKTLEVPATLITLAMLYYLVASPLAAGLFN